MTETRRRLGSLASEVNVGGADALRRRVGPEQSPVQRQISRMYARREEAWRPLNKYRVAAFLRLFFLCFVEVENGLQLHPVTYKMLQKTLVTRIIPFICRRLVATMDETFWIISFSDFKELDHYLLPTCQECMPDNAGRTLLIFFKKWRSSERWRRRRRMLGQPIMNSTAK